MTNLASLLALMILQLRSLEDRKMRQVGALIQTP